LNSFKEISDQYGISDLNPVATAAIRSSVNSDDIVKRVKEELDLDIKVITGKEEAFFGFHAVTHTISTQDAVTIDIGGGGTGRTFSESQAIVSSTGRPPCALTRRATDISDSVPPCTQAIRAR